MWVVLDISAEAPVTVGMTFEKFVELNVQVESLIACEGSGRVVAIGHIPKHTVRSGPPMYVFDRNGVVISVVHEHGEGGSDDPAIRDCLSRGQRVTPEAAAEMFDKHSAP